MSNVLIDYLFIGLIFTIIFFAFCIGLYLANKYDL